MTAASHAADWRHDVEGVISLPPTPVPVYKTREQPTEDIRSGFTKVDWTAFGKGRYFATQLHGLTPVGAILVGCDRVPREAEEGVAAFIQSWIDHTDSHERAWFEGAVVKRLANLLAALNYIRRHGALGALSVHSLLAQIDAQITFLLDRADQIYEIGNHGVRQDIILAAAAISLPMHSRAQEMLRLATTRLETAAVELFTIDGIWKEHAPGYVNYALRLIDDAEKLHDAAPYFNPAQFLSRRRTCLEYLSAVLMPDGSIPYIGRSGARYTSVEPLPAQPRSISVFPGYGHAVIRGDGPNGLYLLFVAGQNLPAGKRHADDLSFILYHHGRAWFTEGGHGGYGKTDLIRHLASSRAHNTYTRNDGTLSSNRSPELATRITGYSNDPVYVSGYTERFGGGARFERTIEVHDFSAITITDALRGPRRSAWKGRLHFPGDLQVTIDRYQATAEDPITGTKATLNFRSEASLVFSTCPGWGNPSHQFGPATTLMWSFNGDSDVRIDIEWE